MKEKSQTKKELERLEYAIQSVWNRVTYAEIKGKIKALKWVLEIPEKDSIRE